MDHRGALRKTKAIDLGLDVKSSTEFDEFQIFVAQSHGKSAAESLDATQSRSEPKPRSKQHSYDAEISIPVPQPASHRNWPIERSVTLTHDTVAEQDDGRARAKPTPKPTPKPVESSSTPSKASRLNRAATHDSHSHSHSHSYSHEHEHEHEQRTREYRSTSSSPRPASKFGHPSHDASRESSEAAQDFAATRRHYKTHKHLTVPGHDDLALCSNTASNGTPAIHVTLSAEQLAPTNPHDGRRLSRGDSIVRNFTTSSKGILNIGDSFKSEESSASTATSPGTSRRSSFNNVNQTPLSPLRKSKNQSTESASSSTKSPNVYIVHVIGENAVGKTSLRRQFATSEYLGDSDPDLVDDDDADNPTEVTVQVDDHLAIVLFFEVHQVPDGEQEQSMDDVDAYLIVYAIDQLSSFQFAEHLLMNRLSKTSRAAPAILVANKSDLVRTQVIGNDDGKALARQTQCLFAETSATLCHRLDELLVQIVQEANGRHQPSKARDHTSKITKWLGKLGDKINPKLKKWHSSPKRSLDAELEPDA